MVNEQNGVTKSDFLNVCEHFPSMFFFQMELLEQSHRQTLMSFISISIQVQCNSIEISCTGMTADP